MLWIKDSKSDHEKNRSHKNTEEWEEEPLEIITNKTSVTQRRTPHETNTTKKLVPHIKVPTGGQQDKQR